MKIEEVNNVPYKTKLFLITINHGKPSQQCIGRIEWNGKKKEYCLYPNAGTCWKSHDLITTGKFMASLNASKYVNETAKSVIKSVKKLEKKK